MNLETPMQRIVVFALSLAFLAVLAIVFGSVVASLSDANQQSFGNWFQDHWSSIWKVGVGVLPAIITYLFGRRAGQKVGKTEAYNSAIATAEDKQTGDAAARVLRREAKGHGLRVTA